MKDWRQWVRGLIGAAINSAAGAGTLVVIDPVDFDPFGGGMVRLLKVSVALGVVGAFMWLKQHPLPVSDE